MSSPFQYDNQPREAEQPEDPDIEQQIYDGHSKEESENIKLLSKDKR